MSGFLIYSNLVFFIVAYNFTQLFYVTSINNVSYIHSVSVGPLTHQAPVSKEKILLFLSSFISLIQK